MLAAAGIAAAGFVGSGGHATAAIGDCTPVSTWPADQPDLDASVLSLINAHRASLGLPVLQVSSTLTASAVWKARHMAQYNELTHDDQAPPVTRSFADRIAACGYSGPGAGENIAWYYPTAASVVSAWLASPDHRANIEGPWTATGLGAAVGASGQVYWVEDFGFPDGSSPPPPPTTTTTPPPPPPPATTTTVVTTTAQTTAAQTTTTASSSPPAAAATAPSSSAETVAPQSAASHTALSVQVRCVVPGVFDVRVAVAARRVRAQGCAVRTMRVSGQRIRPGRVAWQSPRGRVNMPAGSVVTLAVSARG